ncbi:unnamed protein product [Owenia fusiformis]|uniref:Protein odr-4 homolog n=1 Tax=Owenia fusiformis TaxID=6347 RepID=A0A8S4P785_OWEFU|nr:unnamed protein product [Owenia fusiformis]
MGRTIVAEEAIDVYINSLYAKNPWLIGLVVGQVTPQKDYVVQLIKSPPQGTDDDTKRKGKMTKPNSLENIDEQWIAMHAKQVLRMLPGGLDILGVFALGTSDMLKSAQAKLRQTVFAVHRAVCKSQQVLTTDSQSTDRVILHICSTTRKSTCRTIDVADNKSTLKPAEWKLQAFLDRWHVLHTKVGLNLNIPVQKNSTQNINKQLQSGIKPFCTGIWSCMGTIGNQILDTSSALDTSSPPKKTKQKSSQVSTERSSFNVGLLLKHRKSADKPGITRTECGAMMSLRGTMTCRGYVHNKATVGEALQAVKTDVLRSLAARCELLAEEVGQTEEDQDPKVLYETPRRVFSKELDHSLSYCDYVFPDETSQDILERFSELLDTNMTEEQLDLMEELLPSDDDLVKPEKRRREVSTSSSQKSLSSTSKSFNMEIGAVIGAAIATIAAGVSYMYLGAE